MIKFKVDAKNNRKLIGLGITEENVKGLKEGKPIFINGEEVDIPGIDIMVFYGKDEKAIQDSLQNFIGPHTDVRDETKKDKH